MRTDNTAGKPHNGKYVAYYRVSTDRQGASGLGIEAQRDSVLGYLNGGQWILAGEFVEVESGRSRRRPELRKALELCRKEKATLIVAKLDRLYRNLHAMTSLMEAGIDFVAADNPHANKLTIHLLAAIAEHERDLISERTRAALKAVKKRGVKLGSPNPKKGSRVGVKVLIQQADEYADRVLPIVNELQRHGYHTLRDIAKGLMARGVKTPRGNVEWHPAQVANLIKRA
ncbi:MAG: recombinase family protein [Gemmatimonadota bacterium]|jgi:DNA invertase Pin-like site-specific DNA recombinase